MKQITPYASYQEALEAFDNGGKLINLFSHAHDGVVSPAELGKVVGDATNKQAMILYLVMSISRLDTRSRERVLARLDSQLFDLYEKYRPVPMSLDQMLDRGKPGISTTLVGTVKKITTNTALGGSIMVPVAVGAETSFALVPIENSYELYEMRAEDSDRVITIAHHKDKNSLPERKLRVGGLLTSLSQSEDEGVTQSIFLEAQFYMEED